MKKLLFLYAGLLLCLCKPNTLLANRAAGGELIYEWISDSTYRFFVKFYRDCSGDTADATMPLCFKNPCNSSSFNVMMNRWVGQIGTVIPIGCSQYKNSCDSPGSTIPGFMEYWYSATVTMPSRCNTWKAYTYIKSRNASINIQNATIKEMYLECGMNNTGFYQGNSSPYFSIKPILYTAQNQYRTYNSGAIDPNTDSLSTEIIPVQTGVAICSDTPSNAVLNNMTPTLSILGNPFQTKGIIYLTNPTVRLF